MKKKFAVLVLIVIMVMFVTVQPGMADDGMLGPLHVYAPYSFWNSADVFIDDPEMDAAWKALVDAAVAMGKTCYGEEGGINAVKDFFTEMFTADFAAPAIGKNQTFTYYDDDGAIDAVCRYRYIGPEEVSWMGYPMEWHKYKRVFCVPRPTRHFKRSLRTPYKYVVATQVHQHGDGMIHAHLRYGHTGFDDLMTNPDYDFWWPTMALYGDTTTEKMAGDLIGEPDGFAGMLPECPAEPLD